jgi:hypothetical protein
MGGIKKSEPLGFQLLGEISCGDSPHHSQTWKSLDQEGLFDANLRDFFDGGFHE